MSSTTENAPWGNPLDDAEGLIGEGRAAEAAELLRALIDGGRGGLLARMLYARALIAAGDRKGALAVARETAQLNPGVAPAALALGEAMLANEQLPTAIGEFQRALRLDPDLDEARFLLGCAWLQAGEADRAQEAFTQVALKRRGSPRKSHRRNAMRARPRSDSGYVRHLFDQFSSDYDARMLMQLSYRAPYILRELADLTMAGRANLGDSRFGLRHRPFGHGLQGFGGAAGRHRSQPGDDRESAGARYL